jgi:hypothetical protein
MTAPLRSTRGHLAIAYCRAFPVRGECSIGIARACAQHVPIFRLTARYAR